MPIVDNPMEEREDEDVLELLQAIESKGIDYPKENLGTPIGTITLKDEQLFIVPLVSHELIPLNTINDIKKLRTLLLMKKFAWVENKDR